MSETDYLVGVEEYELAFVEDVLDDSPVDAQTVYKETIEMSARAIAAEAAYRTTTGGGGGPPSGAAGGVLGGTYPNPSFAADMATQAELDSAIASAGDVKGFKSVNDYGATQNDSSAGAITANNAAVVAATAALEAEGGGTLWFPGGQTYLSGTHTAEDGVHWKGVGRSETILRWLVDTGAGTWAVVTNPVSNQAAPFFEDLYLLGPAGSVTAGVAGCNMHGLKLSYKSSMRRCRVERFNQGVSIIGDHNCFDDCRFGENYKGVEFPGSIWVSKGNQTFLNCDFTGNGLTGVHVSGDNVIDNVLFLACHWGFGPFGFLRTGAATATMMIDNKIIGGAFEYVGNSAMADFATGGQASWMNNDVDCSGWTNAGAPFYYSGLARNYAFDMPGTATAGGYIKNNLYPFTIPTSGLGVYNFISGPIIYGWTVAANTLFGSLIFFDREGGDQHQNWANATGWTPASNQLVEMNTSGQIVLATGTPPTHAIVGTVVAASGTSWILVKRVGQRFNAVLAETIASGGLPLAQVTGSYHAVGLASNYPANPVIGYSTGAGGGVGGMGGTLASVNARLVLPSFGTPGAQQTYAVTNVTTDRTYDANATTMDELSDVLGTLIADLRGKGIVL